MRYILIVTVLLTLGAYGASAAPPPSGPGQIGSGRASPTPCPNASCSDSAVISTAHIEALLDDLADKKAEFFEDYFNAFSRISEDFICAPPAGIRVTTRDGPLTTTACFNSSFEYEGAVWNGARAMGDWTVRVTCQLIKGCAELTAIEWEHPQVHRTCAEGSECGRWAPGVVLAQRFKTALQNSGKSGTALHIDDFVSTAFQYKFVYPVEYTEEILLQPRGTNWVNCAANTCPRCIESPPLYLRVERTFSDRVPRLAIERLHDQIRGNFDGFLGGLGNDDGVRTGWLAHTPICTEKATTEYLEPLEICAAGYGGVGRTVEEFRFTYEDIWETSNVVSPAVPELACDQEGEPLQAESSPRLFTESGAPTTLFWIGFVGRVMSRAAVFPGW